MDQLYAGQWDYSSDSNASSGDSGQSGSTAIYSYHSDESCCTLLSTSTTYGSYGTWTGKDTCGYEADVESNCSTNQGRTVDHNYRLWTLVTDLDTANGIGLI